MGKGVEKREKEILRHIGGNVDVMCFLLWENSMEGSQKIINRITLRSFSVYLVFRFVTKSFTVSELQNNLNICQQMKE